MPIFKGHLQELAPPRPIIPAMPGAFAPKHPTPLIICDGSIESALAAAHAAEAWTLEDQPAGHKDRPGAPVLWAIAPDTGAPEQDAEASAKRLAERLGLRTVRAPRPKQLPQREGQGEDQPEAARAEAETFLLVRACTLASELGLSRVIWPVRRPDLDAAAIAHDRALLVGRLASLDAAAAARAPDAHDGPDALEIVIDTPYLDLTDEQIAELIDDIGAPIDACRRPDEQTVAHASQ